MLDQGYWLDSDDFVSTADLDAENLGKASQLDRAYASVACYACGVPRPVSGQVGFPRDWPGVYGSSKALKQLVGKKGKCAGKKAPWSH